MRHPTDRPANAPDRARGEVRPGRRTVLKAGVGFGLGLGFAPGFVWRQDPASEWPREGDVLVKDGDGTLRPLTPADIVIGAFQTMAWAMEPAARVVRNGSRLNRLMLLRFDPSGLGPDTRSRAADGVVAYTAICTHTGCEVEEWLADEQLLSCPCHFTRFNPKEAGRVVDGPAARSLPALPLAIADGVLVVAKPFVTPVGFDPA